MDKFNKRSCPILLRQAYDDAQRMGFVPFRVKLALRAKETFMSAIPTLLIIWGAVAACFLGLLAYRGQLTRYEEDQLFLSDTVTHEQQEQTEIVRKVNKIQPFVRIFGVASALMTAGIIGVFTFDAWQHMK
jgi:hypothetical protein